LNAGLKKKVKKGERKIKMLKTNLKQNQNARNWGLLSTHRETYWAEKRRIPY
jgi:hypothetical protein